MVAFSTSYGEQKLERQQISRQDQSGGHPCHHRQIVLFMEPITRSEQLPY